MRRPWIPGSWREQSLKDEENRFQHGVSTVTLVIQAQRDLANDEDAEVQAMANYTHAKIAFDLAMGRTLDVNHISMQEAVNGHVAQRGDSARIAAGPERSQEGLR